jgi:hypothetical protein
MVGDEMDKISPGVADAEDCLAGTPAGSEYLDDGFDKKSPTIS